jgi:hypothetical protein
LNAHAVELRDSAVAAALDATVVAVGYDSPRRASLFFVRHAETRTPSRRTASRLAFVPLWPKMRPRIQRGGPVMRSVFNIVMRIFSSLLGLLVIAMGGIWILQGLRIAFL